MKVFRGLPNAAARAPCALTIGNFDGVHRGHQALLARVRAAADRLGLESAVMTFEPHPREFFAGKMGDMSKAPPRIANLRDKLQALENNGVDRVIVEHFCDHFAGQSPQTFVEKVLVEGLHVKWLMVGDDFCYGAKRAGNVAMLAEAGRHTVSRSKCCRRCAMAKPAFRPPPCAPRWRRAISGRRRPCWAILTRFPATWSTAPSWGVISASRR